MCWLHCVVVSSMTIVVFRLHVDALLVSKVQSMSKLLLSLLLCWCLMPISISAANLVRQFAPILEHSIIF